MVKRENAATPAGKAAAPGVTGTLDAIAAGRATAKQAVENCRERARACNGRLAAFTVINDAPFQVDPALPLAGIAVGVKDLYDTAGLPTAYGSAVYRDNLPKQDAWLVARLKALGAFVAGKTVTTEFAWRQAGPTVNPFDERHTPGGSSSGSAAAVAAGIVPLALGSQTFGSVVRPAAFCGVAGFKPSYGVLSLEGVHPLCPTLDHAGYFARSAADIERVHGLVTGRERQPGEPAGRRLRLVKSPFWGAASPRQQAALDDAAAQLGRMGFSVSEHELPRAFDAAVELAETILRHEAVALYRPLIDKFPDQVGSHMRELVECGEALAPNAHAQAVAEAGLLRAAFAREMEGFDAVLTLPALGEAPFLADGTGNPGPCVLWTLLGVPSLSLPWTSGAHGLPLGIQLAGKAGEDFRLLALASEMEAHRGPAVIPPDYG